MEKRFIKRLVVTSLIGVVTIFWASNILLWQQTGLRELSEVDSAHAVDTLFAGSGHRATDARVLNWFGMQDAGSQAKFVATREAVQFLLDKNKLEKVESQHPGRSLRHQTDDPSWWDPERVGGELYVNAGSTLKFIPSENTVYLKTTQIVK